MHRCFINHMHYLDAVAAIVDSAILKVAIMVSAAVVVAVISTRSTWHIPCTQQLVMNTLSLQQVTSNPAVVTSNYNCRSITSNYNWHHHLNATLLYSNGVLHHILTILLYIIHFIMKDKVIVLICQ